jgi:hypothetical protein
LHFGFLFSVNILNTRCLVLWIVLLTSVPRDFLQEPNCHDGKNFLSFLMLLNWDTLENLLAFPNQVTMFALGNEAWVGSVLFD